jgi:proteasome lid subunit RPN8/RPN11
MEQEVLEAIWRFDSASIETGGWLYGLYPPDAERVTIAHVSGPGRNADHGIGRVRLSEPLDVERDFSDAAARAGLVRVGDWHSHPARDPIPSNGDLIAWATNGDRADVLPYASVILTPGELGWAVPEFFGWVTREDDQGFLVCEPALLSDF